MDSKILKDLRKLEREINSKESKEISEKAISVADWGGADVIITNKVNKDIKTWLDEEPLIISLQRTQPKRRVVETKYHKELSWLFEELKSIFSYKIDFISKYDFYGSLAQSALDYLRGGEKTEDVKGLLLHVLNTSKEIAKLPEDISLPFFAYGIFKPGQLCFSRIRGLVSNVTKASVHGLLKERDGIPLLIESNYSNIKGYLIRFNSGSEIDAYRRIIQIEPEEVYRWAQIKVNDQTTANVLLGRREKRGSSDLEDIEEWDGRNDPLFTAGLEEVESILESNKEFYKSDYRPLFRLQMAYTLLWTAIERYVGLRYHLGQNATNKVRQIATEITFAKSLKRIVTEHRVIYDASDLEKYSLDPDNPQKSIEYYYQVRSNVVHRGKSVYRDFEILRASLEELLAIFKDVLEDAFEENEWL